MSPGGLLRCLLLSAAALAAAAPAAAQTPDLDASRVDPLTARVLDLVPRVRDLQGAGGATAGAGTKLSGLIQDLAARNDALSTRRRGTQTAIVFTGDVLFAFDSAEIQPAARKTLAALAEVLAALEEGMVVVEGHTDSKGSDDYNLALSQRRAEAVVDWLRKQTGLEPLSFQAQGRGEQDPVAPNTAPDGTDDPAGRSRNRRVEFLLP